jgi:transposase-like protein
VQSTDEEVFSGKINMEQARYQQLVASLEGLTDAHTDTLLQPLRERQDTDGAQCLITVRMKQEGNCQRCQNTNRYRRGTAFGAQRFRRKDRGDTCTVAIGIPFHRLRDKTKLPGNAAYIVDGHPVRKTAARTDIAVQKASRWRHKFLTFHKQQEPSALSSSVEVDETSFLVHYKCRRKVLPHSPKRCKGKAKDGSGVEKSAVTAAVQRGTQIAFDQVLDLTTGAARIKALRPVLRADAVLSTDSNASLLTLAQELQIKSGFVVSQNHGKGSWHVQNANRYYTSLESTMARFRGVATQYLANYLGWRRLLDCFNDQLTPAQFLFHALRTSNRKVVHGYDELSQ